MSVGGFSDDVMVRRLDGGPGVEAAVCRFAAERGAFCLESTAPEHRDGRYSILGCEPVEEVVFARADGGWLEELKRRVGRGEIHPPRLKTRDTRDGLAVPAGGWVGYVGYEAGAVLEGVVSSHERVLGTPDVWFGRYAAFAVFDHWDGRWTVAGEAADVDRLTGLLADAREPVAVDWDEAVAGELVGTMSRGAYVERVERAKEYIAAGDIYQVNLTQRFSADCGADGLAIYRRLRRANRGAMSAYLRVGEACICSSSPELFLRMGGGQVVTRPIKGTKPRSGDVVLDEVNRRGLTESEKDLAELTMIVDLLRNDLGRVAEWGSVRVEEMAELERHPTVFHLVATISSMMRAGMDWADLLRATLPGGSITGCPKIRAMQIIDELEVGRRDVYCGAIGYIGLDGSLQMNVAIRTMVVEGGRVHVYGGGAITADSEAGDEWMEVEAKISGMVQALRGTEVRVQQERMA